jgi:hypothetical protein
MAADASLLVVNHYNQTGSGAGLKRITQTGSGEWVDSWLLASHRQQPNVGAGRFWLQLEVGSRQWGGTTWDLDVNLGTFDPEDGSHDGPITWDVRRHVEVDRQDSRAAKAGHALLAVLQDHPDELTMTEAVREVGGRKEVARAEWDRLAGAGAIRSRLVKREGRRQAAEVWSVNHLQGTPEAPAEAGSAGAPLGTTAQLPGTTGEHS